jgi:beta-mannosidase
MLVKTYFFCLFLFLSSFLFAQNIEVNLNKNWQFKSTSTELWQPAIVPGSVHTNLIRTKQIENPFYGDNEKKLQWIDTSNWEYKCQFNIDKSLFNKKNIDIVFDGLDTYAFVYVNDELLMTTNNMFVQWVCNIKPVVKLGTNNIRVVFNAAKKITDNIAKANLPNVYPDNNRVYVRKAQYQFGWDWGPVFIGAGIWKKVWIDAYDDVSNREKKQIQKDILNANRKIDIHLIQEKDSIGRSFYFEKNGVPIYMKGANWIPASIFPDAVTKKDYRELLIKAKEANMNMLRVWGGGIYESDDFYDLCDSLGIYVWQDFMFAGGMYPADAAFLQNVKSEVKYQIERLRHHSCIVLWCGNNEIEEAWKNWGWQNQYNLHGDDSARIWHEYETLFKDSLEAWTNEFDGTRPYVSTSPMHGWGRKESYFEGDSHFWGLWWGLMDWEVFKEKTGRFVSEYGMQSMSNYNTVKTYTPENERKLNSKSFLSHQKANEGFKKLNHYLTRYFIDSNKLKSLQLKEYVYLSQCLQAYILRNSIAIHRSKQPMNMGTLLWQLNDCWPVTSWSILDASKKPKASWYAVKNAYAENASNQIDSILPKDWKLLKPIFKIAQVDKSHFSITSNVDVKFVYLSLNDNPLKCSDNYFDLSKGEKKIILIEDLSLIKKIENFNIVSLFDVLKR